MRHFVIVVALASFASDESRACEPCAAPQPVCFSLRECLSDLEGRHAATSGDWFWLDDEERGIAAGFAKLEPPPIAELIRLLSHPDRLPRAIAADALGQIGPPAKAAVPELIKNLDVPRVAGALGDIGDAAAVPALIAALDEAMSAEASALRKLGPSAARALASVVIDAKATMNRRSAASRVLGEMPPRDQTLIVPQLTTALGRRGDPETVRIVVYTLSGLGASAAAALPELRKLRDAAKDDAERVRLEHALVSIGDNDAVVPLAMRMKDARLMGGAHMELSDAGPRARAAAPTLIEVVRTGPWNARSEAAHTLGFIGDARAVVALTDALAAPDWRLTHEAARTLRRLGVEARTSIPALRGVAQKHWSKIVRDEATLAIRVLEGDVEAGLAADREGPKSYYAKDFSAAADHWRDGEKAHANGTCRKDNSDFTSVPRWGSYVPPMAALVGDAWVSFGAMPDTRRPASMVRNKLPAAATDPRRGLGFAYEVDNGWLVGFDRGEWGGEAVFVGVDGRETPFLQENVFGFFEVEGALLAVTGLAHMTLNRGTVFRVSRSTDAWKAEPLVQLPGAPTAVAVAGGRLIVATWDDVAAISKDGSIELVPCK